MQIRILIKVSLRIEEVVSKDCVGVIKMETYNGDFRVLILQMVVCEVFHVSVDHFLRKVKNIKVVEMFEV